MASKYKGVFVGENGTSLGNDGVQSSSRETEGKTLVDVLRHCTSIHREDMIVLMSVR